MSGDTAKTSSCRSFIGFPPVACSDSGVGPRRWHGCPSALTTIIFLPLPRPGGTRHHRSRCAIHPSGTRARLPRQTADLRQMRSMACRMASAATNASKWSRTRSVSRPASTCQAVAYRTSKGRPRRTSGHVPGTVLNDEPQTRVRPDRLTHPDLGFVAEREGFEPPGRLHDRLLSRQLQSTGLCHRSSTARRRQVTGRRPCRHFLIKYAEPSAARIYSQHRAPPGTSPRPGRQRAEARSARG